MDICTRSYKKGINKSESIEYFRKKKENITVVLGMTDIRDTDFDSFGEPYIQRLLGYVQVYNVESIILHPSFHPPPNLVNDIAILEIMGDDISFTKTIQPICLPSPNGDKYTGDIAVAIGNEYIAIKLQQYCPIIL